MKKRKFTWIDGLVIAVVLLLITGTCIKFFVKDTTSVTQETVEFSYKIKIYEIRQFTVDALRIGDLVYGSEGKGEVGVISDIAVEPAETTYTDSKGQVHETIIEGKYNVTLTLNAQGTQTDSIYKVGTYEIKMNKSSSYFTKYSAWSASIIEID